MNNQNGQPANLRLLIVISALYLTQGIPIGLAFEAFPVLWRSAGFSLETIAFVPLAGLPWALKFLWASFVENHWIEAVGRRKSWIFPMQLLTIVSLLSIIFIPVVPENAVFLILLLTGSSFFSATQDIAVDGLAAERMPRSSFANVNALQVSGIMSGMLIGGAGSLYLTGLLGYSSSIFIMAILVLLCSLPLMFWREPALEPEKRSAKAGMKQLFKRKGALPILLLAFSITLAGAVIFSLAKLMLVDAGWSVENIGLLSGVGTSLMVLVGCGIAVWLIDRLGENTANIIGLVIVLVAGGFWVAIAMGSLSTSSVTLIWIVMSIGGVGMGITSVGIYTILMRFAALGNQPGTDFTVLQSSQTFGEIVISSLVTGVAASFGYLAGISVALIVGILAIIIVLIFRQTVLAVIQD